VSDTIAPTIPRNVHLIGVGGIHMSGIATILRHRGVTVSGSDLALSPLTSRLEELGVTVWEGHSAANVGQAELVVYTSAAHDDNPELIEARRRGIDVIKRGEMVARLMEGKQVIAIAGTHGKTTTTSLIAHLLISAGLSPTYMLGGESVDLAGNAAPGDGPHFVVEADEYDAAFLNYRPHIALVTNIEPDHLDFYGSFDKVTDTFRRFIAQIETNGHLVACTDSPALQAILPQTVGAGVHPHSPHVVSYGLTADPNWSAKNILRKGVDASSFVVEFRKREWGVVTTQLAGNHNVSNYLGAIAVGHILDLPAKVVRDALASFRGVRRRFECIGETAGIIVMDDYAHHPTEVRATLTAARSRFPGRRLVCLFQPHTYSRTAYLLDGFRTCFADCDLLFISDTYAAREEPAAGMSAEDLAPEVSHPPARYAGNLTEAAKTVASALKFGDVFFTIGAGDIEKVGPLVLNLLRSR